MGISTVTSPLHQGAAAVQRKEAVTLNCQAAASSVPQFAAKKHLSWWYLQIILNFKQYLLYFQGRKHRQLAGSNLSPHLWKDLLTDLFIDLLESFSSWQHPVVLAQVFHGSVPALMGKEFVTQVIAEDPGKKLGILLSSNKVDVH